MSKNIAEIKVIGVGGGGGNAVAYMSGSDLKEVEFCILNTDKQALDGVPNIELKYAIGGELTKGLGAGADPEIGKQAAEADIGVISEIMEGANMTFITAGMGGGTGTGAAPVIARCSKEKGILTIAVVTTPFSFEGKKRVGVARDGLEELKQNVDSIIVIPNENLLQFLGPTVQLTEAFNQANDVLFKAVKGVSELITKPGLINIDFADIRTIMKDSGYSMMGIGRGNGANRAKDATIEALRSPLLGDIDVKGAKGLLINISASENMSLGDFQTIGDLIESYAGDDATTVVGTTINSSLGDEIQVTVVATGLPKKESVDIDSNANDVEKLDDIKNLFAEVKKPIIEPSYDDKKNKKGSLIIPGFFKR
jgi:cell division protein FtsZ